MVTVHSDKYSGTIGVVVLAEILNLRRVRPDIVPSQVEDYLNRKGIGFFTLPQKVQQIKRLIKTAKAGRKMPWEITTGDKMKSLNRKGGTN